MVAAWAVPWQENCVRSLRQRPVLIVHGNVQDYYVDPTGVHAELISLLCSRVGDAVGTSSSEVEIRTYDWVRGHDWLRGGESELGGSERPRTIEDLEHDLEVLRGWLSGREASGGVATHVAILQYADLLLPYQASYEDAQRHALMRLQQLLAAVVSQHKLVLIALEDAWLPPHLYTSSPHVGVLRVPLPNQLERATFLDNRLARPEFTWPGASEVRQTIIEVSEGLYLRELAEVLTAVRASGAATDDGVREVLREWRTGARESPWTQLSIEKIAHAPEWLSGALPGSGRGVEGQGAAVDRVARALAIARAGLSGLASGRRGKPRMTLLFAGPTGVGKTELAKRLAAFVFGDDAALVRFDMSEYKDEFTVSRLLGAPPGYVGHEQGGLLARAIEERPFCVLLFDEIEKAHEKILDIFLQILDDGRVTDARGQTVFFAETAIIFTSNIGARNTPAYWAPRRGDGSWPTERERLEEIFQSGMGLQAMGDPPGSGYPAVQAHFIEAVQRYFSDEIGRPELLNRLRSGIIAFNPIEDPGIKARIAAGHIEEMERRFAAVQAGERLTLVVERDLADAISRAHLECPGCGQVVLLPEGALDSGGGASEQEPLDRARRRRWSDCSCPSCGEGLDTDRVPARPAGHFGGRGVADDLDELLLFHLARAVLARRHPNGAVKEEDRLLHVSVGPRGHDGCQCLIVRWERSASR